MEGINVNEGENKFVLPITNIGQKAMVRFYVQEGFKAIADAAQTIAIDPKRLREKILNDVGDARKSILQLSRMAFIIAAIGPNPDRNQERIDNMSDGDEKSTVTQANSDLWRLLTKFAIRGTQFQAAFPDLVAAAMYHMESTWGIALREVIPKEVLPRYYQFPGSAPVLPDNVGGKTREEVYILFQQKFSTLVNGDYNEQIVRQSLEWRIDFRLTMTSVAAAAISRDTVMEGVTANKSENAGSRSDSRRYRRGPRDSGRREERREEGGGKGEKEKPPRRGRGWD